jgi:hypothetical protein
MYAYPQIRFKKQNIRQCPEWQIKGRGMKENLIIISNE